MPNIMFGEPPKGIDRHNKPWWIFSFGYEHLGSEWTIDIPAYSLEDAKERREKIADAEFKGLVIEEYPEARLAMIKSEFLKGTS